MVAVVDALGYLVRFLILPGHAHDLAGGLTFVALIRDQAFDADWLLGQVGESDAEAVVPSKRNRTEPREYDREMHGRRHQVENFFARIKESRAVATRHDRTDGSFAAAICLTAGVIAAT